MYTGNTTLQEMFANDTSFGLNTLEGWKSNTKSHQESNPQTRYFMDENGKLCGTREYLIMGGQFTTYKNIIIHIEDNYRVESFGDNEVIAWSHKN